MPARRAMIACATVWAAACAAGEGGNVPGLRPPAEAAAPDDAEPPLRLGRAWPLSLEAAVRAALDDPGVIRTLEGRVRLARATHFDPAIAATADRAARGAFDPRLRMEGRGSRFDQPPEAFLGPGVETASRFNEVDARAALQKRFRWGGVASAAFDPNTAYLFFPDESSEIINPAYSTRLAFEVRQPLLRGAGGVNSLPFQEARVRRAEASWEVRAAVQGRVRGVVEAYWRLHAALSVWQAVRRLLPLTGQIARVERLRLEEERTIYADYARSLVILESLRRREAEAWADVRSAELALRQLCGLPATDASTLVPSDGPGLSSEAAPSEADLAAAAAAAAVQEPSIRLREADVDRRRVELAAARDAARPRLDVTGRYRASGLRRGLGESFTQLGTLDYPDWTLGLEYDMPLGNNAARAGLRAAELALARSRALALAEGQRVQFDLAELRVRLRSDAERYRSGLRQAEATGRWVEVARVRFLDPPPGPKADSLLLALLDYQTAIDRHLDSVESLAGAHADYRSDWAAWHELAGTLLSEWRIEVTVPGVDTADTGATAPWTGVVPLPGREAPTHALTGHSFEIGAPTGRR